MGQDYPSHEEREHDRAVLAEVAKARKAEADILDRARDRNLDKREILTLLKEAATHGENAEKLLATRFFNAFGKRINPKV